MDKAIERASRPDATASYVIKDVISEHINSNSYSFASNDFLLSNSTNSALYFSALSNPSFLVGGRYHGGIVGLLLLVTPQLQPVNQMVVSEEQASLYMKAVAVHVDAILGEWACGSISNRNVEDISKALGFAAQICSQQSRSLISSSGILPALAKLITGYQSYKANHSSSLSNPNSATTAAQEQGHINRLKTQNFLTCVHPEFLQIAILAGHYRLASTFVQRHPVHAVDQHNWNYDSNTIGANNRISNNKRSSSSSNVKPLVSSESFVRYFYYLGMIHLGCDDYTLALSAFNICLKVPANAVSAVMIATWKKMILARCLALALDDEEEYLSSALSSSYQKKMPAGGGRRDENDGGTGGIKKSLCPLTRAIMELPLGVSSKVTEFLEGARRVSYDIGAVHQDGTTTLLSSWVGDDGEMKSYSTKVNFNDDSVSSSAWAGNDDGIKTSSTKTNMSNDSVSSSAFHFCGMPYYHSLVSSFAKCDISSVLKLLRIGGGITSSATTPTTTNVYHHIGILKKDGNMGLVQRLVPAIKHRLVRKLGRIYEAVPLDKFNHRLGILGGISDDKHVLKPSLAEDCLMHLALKKREESSLLSSTRSSSFQTPLLEYTIDMENSIVNFFQDGYDDNANESNFDSDFLGFVRDDAQVKLANRITTCMDLAERVANLDITIATSAKYQTNMMKDGGVGGGEEASGEGTSGGPRSVMDYYAHGIP